MRACTSGALHQGPSWAAHLLSKTCSMWVTGPYRHGAPPIVKFPLPILLRKLQLAYLPPLVSPIWCGAAADFRAPYWFWKSNMARDAQTRRQDGARCTVAARRWGNHPVRLHFPPSGPRNHNWCWSSSYRKRIAAPMLSARAPPPPHPQRQDPDG